MKNYADRPSASVDNTLRDLFNSSYPKKAEFINFFIISFKIIPRGVGGGGANAKVPSVGGVRNIFWNYTLLTYINVFSFSEKGSYCF